MTSFLEKVVRKSRERRQFGDIWVLVITGSGAHSPEGPVLRDAVQNLLEKRKMKYSINRGKGSFTVNANSGIEFYEPGQPVCSKVILKEAPAKLPAIPKGGVTIPGHNLGLVYRDDAPTPNEVAATEKAIEASRVDQQRCFREEKKEEKILKTVISKSLLEIKKEQDQEEQMFKHALSLSALESSPSHGVDFERDLRVALELSKNEVELPCESLDEELQKVLELSQKVMSREDEELQQSLALSVEEFHQEISENATQMQEKFP